MNADGGDFYSLTGVSDALAKELSNERLDVDENENRNNAEEQNQNESNENQETAEENQNNQTTDQYNQQTDEKQENMSINVFNNEILPNNTEKRENDEDDENNEENVPDTVDKMSQNEPVKSSFESPGNIDSDYGVAGFNVVDDVNLIPECALNMTLDLNTLQPLETPAKDLDEVTKALQAFHDKGVLPAFHLRQKVLQYLERQKVNALVKLKYSEAKEAQDDIQKITSGIVAEDTESAHLERIQHYEEKIQEAEQNLADTLKETEDMLKRKMKVNQEKRNQLKSHQVTELDDFEQRWNNEDFLKKFAKPSNELMKLRTVERALVGGRDFLAAEETRQRIELLEASESETAQEKAEQSMEREQDRLMMKHQRELAAFDELAQREIKDIEREQKVKTETIGNRLAKLRNSLAELKKRKPLPPLPQTPASAPPESTITPRTTKRYNVYKCVARNPKITIKPLGKAAAKRRSVLTKAAKF